MTKKGRKTWQPGNVFAIPLSDGKYAFGVVCVGEDVAFYDYKSEVLTVPDGLQDRELAFRVPVARDAPKAGGWSVIGNVELKGACAQLSAYAQRAIASDEFYIWSGGEQRPATAEECKGLETAATWFSMHVQDRLEDYFAGRSNLNVQVLRSLIDEKQ